MKKMILNYIMIALVGVLTSTSAVAGIDCKPGMNNCPPAEAPNDGLTLPHSPSKPTLTQASGYFEVASPDCLAADMQVAKQGAEAKALVDAQATLGTTDVKQTSAARYLILSCEQSIYAGSAQGNSWIVHAVVNYSL